MKGLVWFQKIPIPPPWEIIQNYEGEGGGSWESIFQRVTDNVQNIESNVTWSEAQKYSRPWDEVNIISFNVSVFLWVS